MNHLYTTYETGAVPLENHICSAPEGDPTLSAALSGPLHDPHTEQQRSRQTDGRHQGVRGCQSSGPVPQCHPCLRGQWKQRGRIRNWGWPTDSAGSGVPSLQSWWGQCQTEAHSVMRGYVYTYTEKETEKDLQSWVRHEKGSKIGYAITKYEWELL